MENGEVGRGVLLPGASQFTEQVISCPQHTGDLIFPWLLGHLDI
jgi:hypothetical protein